MRICCNSLALQQPHRSARRTHGTKWLRQDNTVRGVCCRAAISLPYHPAPPPYTRVPTYARLASAPCGRSTSAAVTVLIRAQGNPMPLLYCTTDILISSRMSRPWGFVSRERHGAVAALSTIRCCGWWHAMSGHTLLHACAWNERVGEPEVPSPRTLPRTPLPPPPFSLAIGAPYEQAESDGSWRDRWRWRATLPGKLSRIARRTGSDW